MSGTGNTTKFVSSTGNQLVDGVLTNVAWADSSILYSFPTSSAAYNYAGTGNESLPFYFSTLSNAQASAIHFALNDGVGPDASDGFSVEGFTNATVTAIGSTNSLNPELRFAQTSSPSLGTARVGDFPGNYVTSPLDDNGDVWFGTAYNYRSPIAGNYSWATHIHEIGHALGLKHGHENSIYGPLPFQYDSMEYTIMTYRSYVGHPANFYTNETYGYAQTWMMADIAALQHMYGADFTSNGGNTVYKWNPNSGDTLVNGSVGIDAGANRIFATIWDGNGIDTYDLSSYTTNLSLDLRPGQHSYFNSAQIAHLGNGNYARGNIFNALQHNGDVRSLIEKAIGGSGNDTIVGNAANNTLMGGAGNDTLNGGDGNDYLRGGAGADQINGGSGLDWAYYQTSNVAVTVNLSDGAAEQGGHAQGDVLTGIERVMGSQFNDTITGDSSANYLRGQNGNDILRGGGGSDILLGENGNDYLRGGAGADQINGGSGLDWAYYQTSNAAVIVDLSDGAAEQGGHAQGDVLTSIERVVGSQFNDTITGNNSANYLRGYNGNDDLRGSGGSDILLGENGNDYLRGGAGADTLNGGAGLDWAYYQSSNAGIRVNLGDNLTELGGHAYQDRLISIERIMGSRHNDIIIGDGSNNYLRGYFGNDTIDGAGGNDFLMGGHGADRLNGGSGQDWAYYQTSNGAVRVNLGDGAAEQGAHASGDVLTSIENVTGSNYSDTITGDNSANYLRGRAGNDHLRGGNGGDTLHGEDGNDYLRGGAGADTINGGAGYDWAYYQTSNAGIRVNLGDSSTERGGHAYQDLLISIERVLGSRYNDVITGDNGNNYLRGYYGNDTLNGANGNDYLMGGAGADQLNGGSGLDWAYYQNSNGAVRVDLSDGAAEQGGHAQGDVLTSIERVTGSNYSDTITGNSAANYLRGYGGNDYLIGGAGGDTLNGENGNDYLQGGVGADRLNGGSGLDWVFYQNSNAAVIVNLGDGAAERGGHAYGDVLTGVERVIGSTFNDTITGDNANNYLRGFSGNDTLSGSGGNDILMGEEGADQLNGGSGLDWAYYQTSNAAVIIDLSDGSAEQGGHAQGDVLTSIERVVGSQYDDTITGNNSANYLRGHNGNDMLDGLGGNDILGGGAGADTFHFQNLGDTDTILDFEDGIDTIEISAGASAFSDLAISASGSDAVIAYGTTTINLTNFNMALLSNDDFNFV